MPVKVQKKDGSLQDFDRVKLINGVMKSGATAEQAEEVAKQVEAWLPTGAASGTITSAALRLKVLELLKAVNPVAGAAFEAYQKPVAPPVVENQPPPTV